MATKGSSLELNVTGWSRPPFQSWAARY